MEITSPSRPHGRRTRTRRALGLITALFVAIAGLTVAAPAAAATPWIDVQDDGYLRISVPNTDVEAAVGPVSQVVVEGNFGPSHNWAQIGLQRSGANWTATYGPFTPGLYYYQVTGDDSKVLKDTSNPTSVASEPEWSTFFIPGDSAALLADAPEEAGTIETLTYDSAVAGEERQALVWLPPTYKPKGKKFPVFYLQHGGAQSYRDWVEVGRAEQILDNLWLSGRLEDMIVVMGNGNVPDFSAELLDNLVPAVEDAYNASPSKKKRALAGLSMGGGQTFEVFSEHPGEFAQIGTFGAGRFGDLDDIPVKKMNNKTDLFRVYVGNPTDVAHNDVYDSFQKFDEIGLDYQFDGVNPDAGHNWNAWQENLIDFAPRLFTKKPSDPAMSEGHTALTERFETPASGTTPTPWISDGGFVTFETTADFADAEYVSVWANTAPGGSWLRTEMSKVGDRWQTTIGPLDPWFYHYRLIVDRQAVKDTSNPTSVTSEPAWSTFLVEGEESRLLTDVAEGEGGALDVMTYQSSVAGEERSAYVWTPPGYDAERAEPYPLFVLNHGGGQTWTDWVEVGRTRQILDNLFLDGALQPMVVVMPNGNVSDYPAELLDNIVPVTEATYNVSGDPAKRALAGLSAGGARTISVLKAHPGAFASIGVFSAGFGSGDGVDVEAINAGTDLFRLYIGDITDFVYEGMMAALVTLDELGIEYEFDGVTPGPHGWDVWQKNLIDFAPRLFQELPADDVRPEVALVSPSTAGPFGAVDIQVDASDLGGLERIVANIYQDGTLVQSTQSPMGGAESGTHTATVQLPSGDYMVKYNAHDRAGNVSRTGTFDFTVDVDG
ncbi:esterase family protein [Microbacterium paludicola]|uniref:alpha/beta hydrolase n=1 Tax=Microbacterium paludicola TaxID=300019 RepID=UPI00119F5BB1|nr:alpha/beta hydrolase-fold protein [Microbacterium paludicola]